MPVYYDLVASRLQQQQPQQLRKSTLCVEQMKIRKGLSLVTKPASALQDSLAMSHITNETMEPFANDTTVE
jgi:hypothetical protein